MRSSHERSVFLKSGSGRPAGRSRCACFAILYWLACSTACVSVRADEAVLINGKRVPGELRIVNDKFQFIPANAEALLPSNQIDHVDVSKQQGLRATVPHWWEASLVNGDRFGCHIDEIESTTFLCSSSWFQGLRIRRGAVRAFTRPGGWTPVLLEDLARDSRGWKETHDTGETTVPLGVGGLSLGPPTKVLSFAPEKPIAFGRMVLLLKDASASTISRWRLRVELESNQGLQTITVRWGANANVDVQASGLAMRQQATTLDGTAILLDFESGREFFRVQANGHLAAWTERSVKDVRLHKLSLESVDASPLDGTAKLMVQEFVVARRLDPLPRPPEHRELDEVWLESGDQLFGELRSLNSRELGVLSRNLPRRIGASQVRGLFPRQLPVHTGPQAPAWRLKLLDPSGNEASTFTGVVKLWDAKTVVLEHALLGELRLPRSQIISITPVSGNAAESRSGPTKVRQS
ncbi:hypothetical protein BH10PLA2_BH10PLA2_18260 [soil metagenome]